MIHVLQPWIIWQLPVIAMLDINTGGKEECLPHILSKVEISKMLLMLQNPTWYAVWILKSCSGESLLDEHVCQWSLLHVREIEVCAIQHGCWGTECCGAITEECQVCEWVPVSRIYSTSLLILLQHSVLQYFLLCIEQKLYGPLWVP